MSKKSTFMTYTGLSALVAILALVVTLPARAENEALLLLDGPSIERATLEMIESAEEEILSVEFMIRDDEFGLMKMALLREQARRGVRTVMQSDALHFMVPPAYLHVLMGAGVDVRRYNPFASAWRPLSFFNRDHSKVLVIDGKMVKLGDTNSGNEYVARGAGHIMQSRDIVLTGSTAIEAQNYVYDLLKSPLVVPPEIEERSQAEVDQMYAVINAKVKQRRDVMRSFNISLDAPHLLSYPKVLFYSASEVHRANQKLDEALRRYQLLRRQKQWGAAPVMGA